MDAGFLYFARTGFSEVRPQWEWVGRPSWLCGYAVVLLAPLLRRIDAHHDRLQVAQLVQEAVVNLANHPLSFPV